MMSANSKIQWCDETDNIIVAKEGGWWCRMISPGCVHCYAAELNKSEFFGGNKLPYTGAPPELVLRHDIIESWKRKTKPKRHFVCSMTDVFGEWVTQPMAVTFLRGMWAAPTQTFQVLTKRPDVALDRIAHWLALDGLREVPDNIWIGVSVEDQQRADERIPELLKIPARVRFLSVEPLLAPVDLHHVKEISGFTFDALSKKAGIAFRGCGVDWCIIGGESGRKARPCHLQWIRNIVHQCQTAGVPCFVKQLGKDVRDGWPHPLKLNHPKGGDMAEWPEDLRIREFPETITSQAGKPVLQP